MLALLALLTFGAPPQGLHTGDLVFHASSSRQSVAIQRATHSPYSHVGVVFRRGEELQVLEASATVRFTPWDEFVARGKGGHFQVWRSVERPGGLSPEEQQKMEVEAARMLGVRYDLAFGWDDERLYCSEVAHKLYRRALGWVLVEPRPLGSYDLKDPAVARALAERYGGQVPLLEPMVAPSDLLASPHLVKVAEG